MSVIVDGSSVIGAILSGFGVYYTWQVYIKIDEFVKKKNDELSGNLEKAKMQNRGYDAGVFIDFDNAKPNWEVYKEAVKCIDSIYQGAIKNKIYNEAGERIIEYSTHNNSLRVKGYIMLLECQYLRSKLNDSNVVDDEILKQLSCVETALIELQKQAIPYE